MTRSGEWREYQKAKMVKREFPLFADSVERYMVFGRSGETTRR